jgi:hypothetical protein
MVSASLDHVTSVVGINPIGIVLYVWRAFVSNVKHEENDAVANRVCSVRDATPAPFVWTGIYLIRWTAVCMSRGVHSLDGMLIGKMKEPEVCSWRFDSMNDIYLTMRGLEKVPGLCSGRMDGIVMSKDMPMKTRCATTRCVLPNWCQKAIMTLRTGWKRFDKENEKEPVVSMSLEQRGC